MNKEQATRDAVRNRMEACHVPTLANLAVRANISPRTLYHWMNAPRSTDVLDAIAGPLGWTSADLLEERDRLIAEHVAEHGDNCDDCNDYNPGAQCCGDCKDGEEA
jgi:hypothetical protein